MVNHALAISGGTPTLSCLGAHGTLFCGWKEYATSPIHPVNPRPPRSHPKAC